MKQDYIIQEIRDIREAHATEYDYDLNAIYEDIKQREQKSDCSYVNFPPRKPEPLTTSIQESWFPSLLNEIALQVAQKSRQNIVWDTKLNS